MKLYKFFIVLTLLCGSLLSQDTQPAAAGPQIVPYNGSLSLDFTGNNKNVVLQLPASFWEVPWTEDTFSPGDTTGTITVTNCRLLFLMFVDSTLAGADSLYFAIQLTSVNTGQVYKAPIKVQDLAQTTITTFLTNPIIPGNGLTKCYVWNPSNQGLPGTFTGTFFIARINVNDNVTPYLPKTRWGWQAS